MQLLYSSEINPFETPLFESPIDDAPAFIRASLEEATDERLEARRETEDQARRLLTRAAGSMSEADLRGLFPTLQRRLPQRKPAAARFAPAFVGYSANGLVAHLADLNQYVARIWTGTDEEAWPGSGRTPR